MEKLLADTKNVKSALSKREPGLYPVIVDGLTRIGLSLRQEVSEVDFAAMANALEGYEPGRVAVALDRCRNELLFVPKPKEVIERLPEKAIENKTPNLKLEREFYEPYSERLHLHVFLYEGGYRQASTGAIGLNGDCSKTRSRRCSYAAGASRTPEGF